MNYGHENEIHCFYFSIYYTLQQRVKCKKKYHERKRTAHAVLYDIYDYHNAAFEAFQLDIRFFHAD